MGTYVPSGPRQRRSITEALREAEEDHYLDCPTADFWVRSGAMVLDGILFGLLWTGIAHICSSLGNYAGGVLPTVPEGADTVFWKDPMAVARFATMALRGMLIYGFFLWPLARFGGSPAKLLLGLRVVDAQTGKRLTIPKTVLRELLGKAASTAILCGGWAMALFRPDQRALHDLAAGTVVKRVHGGT